MGCGEGSTGTSSGVSMLELSGKPPSSSPAPHSSMSPLLSSPPLPMLSPHPPHLTPNTCRQHTQHTTPTYTHTKSTHTSGSPQTSCHYFQNAAMDAFCPGKRGEHSESWSVTAQLSPPASASLHTPILSLTPSSKMPRWFHRFSLHNDTWCVSCKPHRHKSVYECGCLCI
uniref:Uncharacterized protein n=1 Tax=Pipistrellus kuhlii TaxID=59472 RepID=A0A7J8B1I0_PIPKU|nr:hypothetical protein mPipKuh1_007816 [Pipistrellus kuhlii]